MRERQTCQGCGTRPDEWLTADGRPDLDAFRATEEMCFGCRAIESRRNDDSPAGVQIALKPRGSDVG